MKWKYLSLPSPLRLPLPGDWRGRPRGQLPPVRPKCGIPYRPERTERIALANALVLGETDIFDVPGYANIDRVDISLDLRIICVHPGADMKVARGGPAQGDQDDSKKKEY